MTRQKAAVLRVIQASPFHLTAEEVRAAARTEIPNIGIATVYRNLHALCGEGCIRRVEMPGEPDRYDRNLQPHDHMVCVRCGRIFDCAVRLDDLPERLHAGGARIIGFQLQIQCICRDCLAREDASAERPEKNNAEKETTYHG